MVARALGYIDDDMPVDAVELNEELGEEPVFLLLPSPLPPLAVVEAIEAALGNLVLMFRCGTAEEARALRAGEVEYLPELAEGEEARLLADRQRATRRLRALAS
jgi:hypothetical protein